MDGGVVKRERLVLALQRLGGQSRHRDGETLIQFRGTTIIIGRRDFSRAMLRRLGRKLTAAGISPEQLRGTLESGRSPDPPGESYAAHTTQPAVLYKR